MVTVDSISAETYRYCNFHPHTNPNNAVTGFSSTAPNGSPRGSSASHRVARNGLLHFLSLALPAVTALFLVPVTVHALGAARFGILALTWALAEGSGMLDFGLGRATVRFVADGSSKGSQRISEIVSVGLRSQTAFGGVAGMILYALAPSLVTHVFSVDSAHTAEAVAVFRVLAFHFPVILCLASLRAALEGAQRFDLSTSLRLPSSVASIAIPAVAASRGASLPDIMWYLLAVRITIAILGLYTVKRVLIRGITPMKAAAGIFGEMLRYSGWVAVSTFLGPALASFDRFALGSILGVAGLGYYTGAAEAANRFLLVPVTAFSALLPALASSDTGSSPERSLRLTRSARVQLAAVLFPVCLALFTFAPRLLYLWLGPQFASEAGMALRILSVGVFLTGLAHLPLAWLYAAGRPDLPAKVNLFQVAVHVPVTIGLVTAFGIPGAALAWSIRCAEDLVFYELAIRSAGGRGARDHVERSREVRLALGSIVLAASFAAASRVSGSAWQITATICAAFLAIYAFWVWKTVLAESERRAWLGTLRPLRTHAA